MEINNSPYVGPRPFDPEDRHRFFGRDQEADKLLSLITAHPVVLLYAPSGAGKTSLINAKLIPLLKTAGFDVLPPTRVQGQTQLSLPLDKISNIFSFNIIANWSGSEVDQSQLAEKRLSNYLQERKTSGQAASELTDEPTPRVVIFDQFEEIFRLYPERWQDRLGFFEQVGEALAGRANRQEENGEPQADPLLRVVFAMREDYIAGLDSYKHLMPEKLRTRFRLEHLREKSAKLAIEKPLEGTGRKFDKGVVDTLVKNLLQVPSIDAATEWETGQYVEPVQLQVVCDNLWLALKPEEKLITAEHLKTHGDVNQALSVFYKRSIESVAKETGIPESELRTWFGTKLIRSEGVRDIVHRGKTHTAGLLNVAVDEFDKLHLIKGELRGKEQWYELAHDRLIWPIRKSNEEWMLSLNVMGEAWRYLESRAEKWDSGGRTSDKLLDTAELHQAQRWRTQALAASLTPSEPLTDLIRTSESARSSQFKRRLTLAVTVLALALLVMSGVTVLAVVQTSNARRLYRDVEDKNTKLTDSSKKLQKATDDLNAKYNEVQLAKNEVTRINTELGKNNTLLSTQQRELQSATETLTQKNSELVNQGIELQRAKDNLSKSLGKAESTNIQLQAAKTTLEAQKDQLAASAAEVTSKNKQLTSQKLVLESMEFARESRLRFRTAPALSQRLAVEAAETSPSLQAAEALRLVLSQQSVVDSKVLRGTPVQVSTPMPAGTPAQPSTSPARPGTALKIITPGSTTPGSTTHEGRLIGAAFSPNGRLIVTFSEDKTARIWKNTSAPWQPIPLVGHEARIVTAVFSPNSELVATASEDKTVRLWKTDTGALVTTFRGHTLGVHALAFSPNGDRIASEGGDGRGFIWDFSAGTSVVLEGLRGPTAAIAFDRTGTLLATEGLESRSKTSVEYNVRIFRVTDGIQQTTIKHDGAITALAFSPTGDYLISASSDRQVQIWATNVWAKPVFTTKAKSGLVTSISFSRNGQYVAMTTGLTVQILRLDQDKWTLIQPELKGHTSLVTSAGFSRDNKQLVTSSIDNTARVWDVVSRESIASLVGHTGGVVKAAFSPTEALVLTASQDKNARLWDFTKPMNMAPSDPAITTLATHTDILLTAAFSKKMDRILTTSTDRSAIVWDASTGSLLFVLQHPGEVGRSMFSFDGKLVVTGCSDGKTRIWDVSSGGQGPTIRLTAADAIATLTGPPGDGTLTGPPGDVLSAAFSHDDEYVLTGGQDGIIRLWNWKQWRNGAGPAPLVITGHEGGVYRATFSKNDRYIVSASADGTARIWNARAGTIVKVLGKNGDPAKYDAAFNPAGDLVVTADDDDKARVWSLSNGELVKTLCGHTDEVYSAIFSPDGHLIVTGSSDKTARIWDYQSGQTIALLNDHTDDVNAATFSLDGLRIITASSDRTARIYGYGKFEPLEILMARASKLGLTGLTDAEKKQVLPLECASNNEDPKPKQ